MDADNFIVHVKTDDIYKDIANVETRFDTSSFKLDRPFPKGKSKKVIGLMKDKLGGQIMKEFSGSRAKTCSYLKDNKAKGTKKCVIKWKLKFQDCKNYLEACQMGNEINHLEKNKIDVDSPEDQK